MTEKSDLVFLFREPAPEDQSDLGEPLKLGRTGILLDRENCDMLPHHYDREAVQNSLDAKVPGEDLHVLITPDWVYVESTAHLPGGPVYRWSIQDDACGMDENELRLFSVLSLSGGDKRMGRDGHFGIGAKASLLPVSPMGLIVMSWKQGIGNMIKLAQNQDGEYVLRRWCLPGDMYSDVVPTPKEYDTDLTGKPRQHGTVMIAVGKSETDDTWLGMSEKRGGLRVHPKTVNRRYFRLPEGVIIQAFETSYSDKTNWPKGREDLFQRRSQHGGEHRTCFGGEYYLNMYSTDRDSVTLEDGSQVHWWYYGDSEKKRKAAGANGYGVGPGFVAVVNQNELYGHDSSAGRFFQFGVHNKSVYQNLTLIVEPATRSTLFPNNVRSNLTDLEQLDRKPPWKKWGHQFQQAFPEFLRELSFKSLAATSDFKKDVMDWALEQLKDSKDRLKSLGFGGGKGAAATRADNKNKGSHGSTGTGTPRGRTKPKVEWIEAAETEDQILRERPVIFDEDEGKITIYGDHQVLSRCLEYWLSGYRYLEDPSVKAKIRLAVQRAYTLSIMQHVMHARQFRNTRFWKSLDYQVLLSSEGLMMAVLGFDLDSQIRSSLHLLGAPRFPKQEDGAVEEISEEAEPE